MMRGVASIAALVLVWAGCLVVLAGCLVVLGAAARVMWWLLGLGWAVL